MDTLGILDLLAQKGFTPTKTTRFVRHKDRDWDMDELVQRGWFEAYQACQARPVFDKADYIVSFTAASTTSGTGARFQGVYKVLGKYSGQEVPPRLHGSPAEWQHCPHQYRLEKQPGFEELEK